MKRTLLRLAVTIVLLAGLGLVATAIVVTAWEGLGALLGEPFTTGIKTAMAAEQTVQALEREIRATQDAGGVVPIGDRAALVSAQLAIVDFTIAALGLGLAFAAFISALVLGLFALVVAFTALLVR